MSDMGLTSLAYFWGQISEHTVSTYRNVMSREVLFKVSDA